MSIQLHLYLVSLRKLQSLKHQLSGIRFLEKKCEGQWFELTYSDAILTLGKEYTWNLSGLSWKAFIHIKYEIHGYNWEECQIHEIISYPSLYDSFTIIEQMQHKSKTETTLCKTNREIQSYFSLEWSKYAPYSKVTVLNVKCVLVFLSRATEMTFPCFFRRTNLSISLLYICFFNSDSSKEPMFPLGVTPKHNLLHF